jgi:hypothetical protein
MKKTFNFLTKFFAMIFVALNFSSCNVAMPSSTEQTEKSYNTIAELYQDAVLGETVSISATVSIVFNNGYMLFDGTNYLGVYNSTLSELSSGQVVKVVGEYSQHHSLFQIYPTSETILDERGVDLPKAKPIDEVGINAITTAKEECGILYNMTVTVVWETSGSYSNIELFMDGNRVGRVHYLSHAPSYEVLKAYAEDGKTVFVVRLYEKDGKVINDTVSFNDDGNYMFDYEANKYKKIA